MNRTNTTPVRSSPIQVYFHAQVSEHPTGISLTNREAEVLQWSAAGKSSWEIAQIVNCTEAGVNYHFNNIRRKFDTSSRRTAVVKALEQGLIHMP